MKPSTQNTELMETSQELMEILNRDSNVAKYHMDIIWLYFDPKKGVHQYSIKITKTASNHTKVMEFNFSTGYGWNVAFEWNNHQKFQYAERHGISHDVSMHNPMSEFMRKISNDPKLIVRPQPIIVIEGLLSDYGIVASGITLDEFKQDFGVGDESKDTMTYAKMCDNFAKLNQLFDEHMLQELQLFIEDIEW